MSACTERLVRSPCRSKPIAWARDACARSFARAAQYFANVLTGADVLEESRAVLRGAFAPDVVCFVTT
jgi:hypothetical protein